MMVWSPHLKPDILECEVKWVLGSITTNKAIGGDRIPVELFQILKDDAVKVLPLVCEQIWKTQQWPQDWKRSVFILIPKKGNAKECSNYCAIVLISHASKVILKILQARLQQSEKAMAPHSSTLAWKIQWKEEPGRLQSMESQRVTERLPFHFSLSCIGEGNGSPLQGSCLKNLRDGEAWWTAVYGGHTESDTTEAT